MSDLIYAVRAMHYGHLAEALDRLERILHETPEHPEALFAMALARLQAGSTDEAHTLLRRAATLDPDLGRKRAVDLFEADFADEAVSCLEAILETGAGDEHAAFLLGLAYAKREQWQPARSAFTRALDVEPGYAAALGAVGTCEFHLGDLAAARATLERALEMDPGDAFTHDDLGHVLLAMDEPRAAGAAFERCLELGEEDYLGEASYHLARCRARLGDRDGVMSALRQARQSGFYNWLRAREEPDLEPLHAHETFQRWLDECKEVFFTRCMGEDVEFAGSGPVQFVDDLGPAFARVVIAAAVGDRDALAAAVVALVDEAQQRVEAGAVAPCTAGDTLLLASAFATEEMRQRLPLQTLLPRMGRAGIPAGTLAMIVLADHAAPLARAAYRLDIYDAFGARAYGKAVADSIDAWRAASLSGDEAERRTARIRAHELVHTAYLLEKGCCGGPDFDPDLTHYFEPALTTPALREDVRDAVLERLEQAGGDATAVAEDALSTFVYDRVEAWRTEPTWAAATLVDLHRDFLQEARPEAARLSLRLAVEQVKAIEYHMNMAWDDFDTADLVIEVLERGLAHRWPDVGRAALDFFAWAEVDLTFVNWVSYRAVRAVFELEGATPPAPWPDALSHAVYNNDLEDIEVILDAGGNGIDDDPAFLRALAQAVSYGRLEAVALFLRRGVDVQATDEDGATLLINAAVYGQLDIVKLLVEHGADIHTTDNDGKTAADRARYSGHRDIVAFLEEAG